MSLLRRSARRRCIANHPSLTGLAMPLGIHHRQHQRRYPAPQHYLRTPSRPFRNLPLPSRNPLSANPNPSLSRSLVNANARNSARGILMLIWTMRRPLPCVGRLHLLRLCLSIRGKFGRQRLRLRTTRLRGGSGRPVGLRDRALVIITGTVGSREGRDLRRGGGNHSLSPGPSPSPKLKLNLVLKCS